jgi:signal transduction histidine kinase
MEKMLGKLTMMNQVNRATNFSEIDLNKLVKKLKTDYSKIIKRRNISFTTNIPANSTFHSYSEVVELLLNNCLENAFYFCQFSKYDKSKVDLTIQKDDYENLYITLRDNGCGIKPEVLDKIWGMFFLGTEISKGNGLGLYMVKKAVESLKGNISITTEIDEYFEISVTLPLIEPSINVELKEDEGI